MINNSRYRITVVKALVQYANGVKHYFVIDFVMALLIWTLSLVTPQFYTLFIDQVILKSRLDLFVWVLVGYVFSECGKIGLEYIRLFANSKLTKCMLMQVKSNLWKRFVSREFSYYDKNSVGSIYAQIEDDTSQISKFTNYQTVDYIFALCMVIGTALILLFIDWKLTTFSLTIIPLAVYFDLKIAKREKSYTEQMRQNNQQQASWVHKCVQGWREIKALNQQVNMKKRFSEFTKRYGEIYAKQIKFWALRVLILPIIRYELLMQFGLYFIGGLLIINGKLEISELLVFSVYHEMFSNALKTITKTDADLEANKPHTDRLITSLEEKPEIKITLLPDNLNSIVFDNVTFSYTPNSKPVLTNFSASIYKGERVAIVGKSGSGKTTLLKLMMGLLQPNEGQVYFANVNLKEIDQNAMFSKIGFVMQENILFNATIRENLLYGKATASVQDMVDACKKACIYDYIAALPDGLDTVIGERGIKLSGGQRQRIALARVFLRDPEVLVLDEATSALDQYSDNLIQDAINNVTAGKTIIVVSHRDSSIQFCDRRILLN